MYRDEKIIAVKLQPGIATFIKHGFNNYVRWPLLNVGIIIVNTTTAVNEEWLTAVEHMPTRKIFYQHTGGILRKNVGFCVYLKCSQTKDKQFVSLYDFDYYIVSSSKLIPIEKPPELKETLLHTFQDYRIKNVQTVELMAFSSGTELTEDLLSQLTFLDLEAFNREYANIKPIISTDFLSYVPFNVIAPLGKLVIMIETYEWMDNKKHAIEVFEFLLDILRYDLHTHKIETTDPLEGESSASAYNAPSGTLYVKDLLTMSVVNFFGYNTRLNSYHRVDIRKIDVSVFVKTLEDAFESIIGSL